MKGRTLDLFVQLLREHPDLVTDYAVDLFSTDYQKIQQKATEGRDERKATIHDYYVLGLRSTGSELFEVGEEPGRGNTRSGAIFDQEENWDGDRHTWFLVQVKRFDHQDGGTDPSARIVPLDDAEDARDILRNNEHDPGALSSTFAGM